MPKDVFEGAPITLEGEVTSGHATATSALFQLTRDGAVLASASAPLDGKKAKAVVPAPLVPDDVDSVAVEYSMIVGGKTYPGGDGFKVWPRDLVVSITRATDGTPFDGFLLAVTHDGVKRLRRTLPDGRLRFVCRKPAAVTVAAETPFEVVAWSDDKGRLRAATGRRAITAAIVTPEKPASGTVEQLVNLKSPAEGIDGAGAVVTVTVCVDGDQTLGPGQRTGREGDEVFLEATFGRESKRNSPLPDLRGVLDRVASPDGKKVTGRVRLGPQGEPARFELALGLAGGDTCTLKVGGTSAVADDARKFVNWRKIFYQLSRPSALSLPDLGPPTQGLEKVFVRYEKYHEELFEEATPPRAPPGTWFDGDVVGLAGRALSVAPSHNAPFFHFLYREEKRPVGMHLLLAHLLIDAGLYGSQTDHVSSPALTAASTITFPPTGAAAVGWTFNVDPAKDKVRGVYRVSFQDGGIPVRNATWRCTAAAGANKGKKGIVPEDAIHIPKPAGLSYADRNTLVHFALPADALVCTAAGDPVVIEADVVWARGPMRGVAMGNDYLALRDAPSAEMGGTMLHEIGHAMDQCLDGVPPGLSAADHGVNYTGRGHQGPHCAFGVDPAAYNAAGKTGPMLGRTDGTCVMFGEHTAARAVAFCPKCEPFAKAQPLESLA